MEELERARRVEHHARARIDLTRQIERLNRTITEGRELRPEALPAREEAERLIEKWECVVSQGFKRLSVNCDRIRDALLYEPCESRRFFHATSLAAAATR